MTALVLPGAAVTSFKANRLLGVDISNLNGKVDWDNFAESGVLWVYIKEGEDRKLGPNGYDYYVDQEYERNVNEALRVGIPFVGTYRFVRPSGTSPAESMQRMKAHVQSVLGKLQPNMFAVCDFEEDAVTGPKLQWLSEYLQGVGDDELLGQGNRQASWLYSGLTYLQRHGCLVPGSTPTLYPYIHASYQQTYPPAPDGYTIRAWQFAADVPNWPGITDGNRIIDLNAFRGTLDDFKELTVQAA